MSNQNQLAETMGFIRSWYTLVHNKKIAKKAHLYKPFEIAHTDKGHHGLFLDRMYEQSTIVLVVGRRGSGKTALGMRVLEAFDYKSERSCYAIGYDSAKLPLWIRKADSALDIPSNSVALVDEGAVIYSSRDSHKAANKAISKLMAVARHKNLSLILITQNSAMIDVNVLRLADTLIIKKPSLMQTNFERREMKKLFDKALPHFKGLKGIDNKKGFYVIDDEFEGFMKAGLPDFWNDKISKSFANL